MADEREVFTILENDSTGAGEKLPARSEGDTVTGNEVPVLPAKDSSGNYAHIPLDSNGNIPVVIAEDGPSAEGTGTATGIEGTEVDVAATAALDANQAYQCARFIVSATQPTLWKFIWDNNGSETTLQEAITGSGQYTFESQLKRSFTTGSSGTQTAKIVGVQLQGPATDLHASIVVVKDSI